MPFFILAFTNPTTTNTTTTMYKPSCGLLALLCFLFCFLACASLAASADSPTYSNGHVVVRFDGDGRLRFWMASRTSDRWTLELESLCEIGSAAAPPRRGRNCHEFGSDDFSLTGFEETQFQGLDVTRVAAEAAIQPSGKFATEVMVFKSSGEYTVFNETFKAGRNAFKWSFNITDFDFVGDASSRLQLTGRLGLEGPSINGSASWNDELRQLSFAGLDSVIEFARFAQYADDEFKPISMSVEVHDDRIDFALQFERGASIYYDPQATMGTDGSASALSSFLFDALHHLLASMWN